MGVTGIAGGLGGVRGVSLMTTVAFGATTTFGFAEGLVRFLYGHFYGSVSLWKVYGANNGAHISSNSCADI